MKKRKSIYFIAKEAGVSVATISRFFNSPEKLNLKRRESVAKICQKYNYEPSSYASAMVTGKTKVITLLTAYIMQPAMSSQILAIERRLTKSGYILNIIDFVEGSPRRNKLKKIINSNKTDGIICSGLGNNSIFEIKDSGIPSVYLDYFKEFPNLPYYKSNNYLGGKIAGEYLAKKGHKKIGIILFDSEIHDNFLERRAGFIYVLKKNNMNLEFEIKIPEKDEIVENIKKTIKQNRESFLKKELDGIFATADIIASCLMNFLNVIGIRVPEDISIIGYDNSFLAELAIPRITSISLDADKVGYLAADNLINKIEKGKYKRKKIVIDPFLYEGKSVLDRTL